MLKINWLNDPKYQKQIQKLMRATPDQKAIINTVIADRQFADAEMRKQLELANIAAQELAHEREYELGTGHHELGKEWLEFKKEQWAKDYELKKEEFDIWKDESDLAELLGYGNILVSGLGGIEDLKRKKREADYYKQKSGFYS